MLIWLHCGLRDNVIVLPCSLHSYADFANDIATMMRIAHEVRICICVAGQSILLDMMRVQHAMSLFEKLMAIITKVYQL